MEGLRKQRGMTKAKLTRLETKINVAQRIDITREQTEVYTTRLDEIRVEFDNVQRQISNQAGETTTTDATEDEEFDKRYMSIKIKLKQMLRQLPELQDEARALSGDGRMHDDALSRVLQQQIELMQKLGDNNGAGGAQASTSNNDAITQLLTQQTELLRRLADGGGAHNQESKGRLPVVKLPTFDGRTEEWKRFAETFQSLIHDNATIPDVQKFQYLISSLSGVAAKVIESIELTAGNYAVAWNLLKGRFDDPRAIKKKHIQCLFSMPRVEKESADAIRGLVDYTLKHLRVLKSLELPTDSWDELIIHMIESKLDNVTLRAWEQDGNSVAVAPQGLPPEERNPVAVAVTLTQLTDFLQKRCQTLERIEARSKDKDSANKSEVEKQKGKPRNQSKTSENEKKATLTASTETGKCYLCNGDHLLYHCKSFLAMSVAERFKEVRRLKLCINCLRNDHFAKSWRMGSCKECSGRHNTLLHLPEGERERFTDDHVEEKASGGSSQRTSSNVAVHHAANCPLKQHVLMATATVNAVRPNGSSVQLRILLDSASEAHFVTQSACKKLGIKLDRTSEIVTGLNEIENVVFQSCDIVIQSRLTDFRANVRCLVVPNITKNLPSVEIKRDSLKIPSNIKLADADFHKTNAIDMLIGAEFFFDLLESGKIELGENLPVIQNTKLGWVVAGSITRNHVLATTANLMCNRETIAALNCSLEHYGTLDKTLERFWEIENVQGDNKQRLSEDEQYCEEFFDRTVTRDNNGRFIVRLPFREDPSRLGESRDIANKRLQQLERRFKKNTDLHERYAQFMREYVDLGHMSPVDYAPQDTSHTIVYLPHHGVIKESSTSTKLRTVFDASSKTSSGVSLNDILHVGPTLQSGLLEIILRFRFHPVALTGDLRKMYRQVVVHPDDRDFQRILWRFSPDERVQDFRLNTLTYGEASSAYLAIKCIRRLAEDSQTEFPAASRVVLDEVYVDDIMSGANSVAEAAVLQEQLTTMLQGGGFEIHKWCSSNPECLQHVPPENREDNAKLNIDANDTIKTLGLQWNPSNDKFQFSVQRAKTATTKREILSEISKFFDPLGLVGPILTSAKLLMQQTWRLEHGWDDPLPMSFIERWDKFREELNEVEILFIPRRVIDCQRPRRIYLQGFCDASEEAYGACVYVQAEDEEGFSSARLLCSKSRVAPIKPLSIPRLELCSAVLLARLLTNVRKGLSVKIDGVQARSDSKVALYWIHGDVSRWKTFVANRVCEIVELLPAEYWNHVKGEENPADLISRGARPLKIQESELWWSGLRWLSAEHSIVINNPIDQEVETEIEEIVNLEERKQGHICNIFISENERRVFQELLDNHSSLTRIERVLAYCMRYLFNLKSIPSERVLSNLSATELRNAQSRLVKHVQGTHFAEEISCLEAKRDIRPTSKLLSLYPFLDEQGVLRVGGRLQLTSLSFDRKHPIILPAGDRFSKLLFEREHIRLLHGGQSLILCSIRERYWPLRGKDMAKQVCRSCVWCARNNPRDLSQVMGSLPRDRVSPSRPFSATGFDFAGPIITLVNKGRGRKTNKSYIALFVCFATKAVHLEATSELTSAAFLATLRRFSSRRGSPRIIYSDNATNFVGANRELQEVYEFIWAEASSSTGDLLANEGLEWKFIPVNSPHMGGLWEAGVKSCKHHLKRIMGNALFTFEELSTVLTQIEACMNSRPLYPMSADSSDLQPLTPAHFLVGGPLTSLPDMDVSDIKLNRLTRWQLIQRVLQDFWRRWASEYVTSLQGRTKWKRVQENLKINDLVVLRDENLPPLKWRLGRVVELHPGNDGLVRVVTVRTASGNFKRALTKICKLPVNSECDAEISSPNLVGGM